MTTILFPLTSSHLKLHTKCKRALDCYKQNGILPISSSENDREQYTEYALGGKGLII